MNVVNLRFYVFLYLVYSRTQSISAGKVSELSRREVAGIRNNGVKMTLKISGCRNLSELRRIRINGGRINEVLLYQNCRNIP